MAHDERRSAGDLPAPVPTPGTLRLRRNLVWQFLRFLAINLKMLKMIGLSHPHRIEGGEGR